MSKDKLKQIRPATTATGGVKGPPEGPRPSGRPQGEGTRSEDNMVTEFQINEFYRACMDHPVPDDLTDRPRCVSCNSNPVGNKEGDWVKCVNGRCCMDNLLMTHAQWAAVTKAGEQKGGTCADCDHTDECAAFAQGRWDGCEGLSVDTPPRVWVDPDCNVSQVWGSKEAFWAEPDQDGVDRELYPPRSIPVRGHTAKPFLTHDGLACPGTCVTLAGEVEGLEAEVIRWKNNTDTERGRRYDVEREGNEAVRDMVSELGRQGFAGILGATREAVTVLVERRTRIEQLEREGERLRAKSLIHKDDVEWVVNDNAELGVKIGDRFFWLYKGHSLVYDEGKHDNGTPMLWRTVGKREFGECCTPPGAYIDGRLATPYTEKLFQNFFERGRIEVPWQELPGLVTKEGEEPAKPDGQSVMVKHFADRVADDMERQVFEGADQTMARSCFKCGASPAGRAMVRKASHLGWECSDEDACKGRVTAVASLEKRVREMEEADTSGGPGAKRAAVQHHVHQKRIARCAVAWANKQTTSNEEKLLETIGDYTDFLDTRRTVCGS